MLNLNVSAKFFAVEAEVLKKVPVSRTELLRKAIALAQSTSPDWQQVQAKLDSASFDAGSYFRGSINVANPEITAGFNEVVDKIKQDFKDAMIYKNYALLLIVFNYYTSLTKENAPAGNSNSKKDVSLDDIYDLLNRILGELQKINKKDT